MTRTAPIYTVKWRSQIVRQTQRLSPTPVNVISFSTTLNKIDVRILLFIVCSTFAYNFNIKNEFRIYQLIF